MRQLTKNEGNDVLSNDHFWSKIQSTLRNLYFVKPKIVFEKMWWI